LSGPAPKFIFDAMNRSMTAQVCERCDFRATTAGIEVSWPTEIELPRQTK